MNITKEKKEGKKNLKIAKIKLEVIEKNKQKYIERRYLKYTRIEHKLGSFKPGRVEILCFFLLFFLQIFCGIFSLTEGEK